MVGPAGASKECKKIVCEFLGIPIDSSDNSLMWSEAFWCGKSLNCGCCEGKIVGIWDKKKTIIEEYLICIKCCCIYMSDDNPLFSLESIGFARPFVLKKVKSCLK